MAARQTAVFAFTLSSRGCGLFFCSADTLDVRYEQRNQNVRPNKNALHKRLLTVAEQLIGFVLFFGGFSFFWFFLSCVGISQNGFPGV